VALSILDTILFGIRRIYVDIADVVTELPERPAIYFEGEGVTVEDDVANNRTKIIIGPAAGAVPETFEIFTTQGLTGGGTLEGGSLTLGFSGINDSQHGARAGGTLHANATTSLAGFMSAADKVKLDGLPAAASVATIDYVDDEIAELAAHPFLTVGAAAGLPGSYNSNDLSIVMPFYRSSGVVVSMARGGATVGGTYDVLWIEAIDPAGAGHADVGTGAVWALQNADGDDVVGSRIESVATAVTAGAHASKFRFSASTAGAAVVIGEWTGGGVLTMKQAGATILTHTHDTTTTSHVYDAAVGAVSWGWTQDASAAGGTWTWEGQRGASGFVGGDLVFVTGKGGIAGTNLAGNFTVRLGQGVSNVTGEFRLTTHDTTFATHKMVAGPTYQILSAAAATSGMQINTTAGALAFEAAASVTVRANGGALDFVSSTSTLNKYGASVALAIVETFAPTGAHTVAHQSTTTSVTDSITQRAGTGANAGAPRTLSAQDGQNVAGGTNNSGGSVTIASGAAGTGGSNGAPGDVIVKTGATSRLTAAGDGSLLSLVFDHVLMPTIRATRTDLASTTTPTLGLSLVNYMLLTGNVTAVAGAGGNDGIFIVLFAQDGTGGRTVAWGSGWNFPDNLGANPDQPGSTANRGTIWVFYGYSGVYLCLCVAKNIEMP
jgi:hypothetical protein